MKKISIYTSFLLSSVSIVTVSVVPGYTQAVSDLIVINGNLIGAFGGINGNPIRGGMGNGFGGNVITDTAGISLDASTLLLNPPNRGNGGAGMAGTGNDTPGGIGGAVGAISILPNMTTITGQNGGDGQGTAVFVVGGPIAGGSSGGGGGAGVFLDNMVTSTRTGMVITGGNGGAGGAGLNQGNVSGNLRSGTGGGGGAGAVVNGGRFTNVANARIVGGAGGARGISSGSNAVGAAGAGGDGVAVQNGGTFFNEGVVEGAIGGVAGAPALSGAAGAGIRGGDNTVIINAGLVRPGLSRGSTQIDSDAIMLVGSNGLLELRAGSDIQGPVGANLLGRAVAKANSGNNLALGGVLPSTFDANEIGTKYLGFEQIRKIGTSRWDVSGANNVLPWSVEEGVLAVNTPVGGPMQVSGGRLIGVGSVESIVHLAGGTVAPGDGGFDRLTVRGNYSAQGGTVEIQTMLGDDNSPTSLLNIQGNSMGAGNVRVINRDGLGALTANGIRIIEVGGQSDAVFSLNGNFVTENGNQAVVGGAFGYILAKGGSLIPDDNWYLKSMLRDDIMERMIREGMDNEMMGEMENLHNMPILNPGAPLYEGAVQVMRSLNRLPTLQERVGNRYWSDAAVVGITQGDGPGLHEEVPAPQWGPFVDGNGIWSSIGGEHSQFKPSLSTTRLTQKIDTFILRTGIDGKLYENEAGSLIGGLVGQYGTARSDIRSLFGRGRIDSQAWGLGATLTWYGSRGFYVDGQLQGNWFSNDYFSANAARSLANNKKATGYAASIEAGQKIALNNYWSTTPQAQLIWSSLRADRFRDSFNADVALNKSGYLTGRAGITLDYSKSWNDNKGMLSRTKLFTILNIYQNLTDNTEVDLSNFKLTTRSHRTWGGIGLGGTYSWNDDKYSIYGQGSFDTSFKDSSKNYTFSGNIGLRVKW